MASSLQLGLLAELLPADPKAPGLHLLLAYDLGDPGEVTAAVTALLLDGERVLPTRNSNRTIVLPILVIATTRADLSAKVNALIAYVKDPGYALTWIPDGGLELSWDCFAAQYNVHWDVRFEDEFYVQQVDLTIPALPFGRSPAVETATATQVSAIGAGKVFALSGLVGSARAPLNVQLQFPLSAVDAWLIHKPPVDADVNAPLLLAVSSNTVTFDASLLRGTYSIVAGVTTYNAPGQQRTVELTVEETGTSVTTTIVRAYTSGTNLRPLVIGNLTLPLVDRPPGSTVQLTLTLVHSGGGGTGETAIDSLMLLDTRGQTVASFERAAGTAYSRSAWVLEGAPGDPIGPIWNSPTALLADGWAASEPRVSGGPLSVSAEEEGHPLLVYAPGGNAGVTVTYQSRWLHERLI